MGVLSNQACIAATVRLDGPKVRGPLPIAEAWELWLQKEKFAEVVKDTPRKRSKFEEPSSAGSTSFATPTKPPAAASKSRSKSKLKIE